ncbi:uncharacterized protein A4U43_C04F18580 [Asparagus officinalis]|uniref:Uncharacterized protein n=1 Tax=Asparagus officinalis TaxID=4686 RepID=A0A5P1F4L7_ASPOF|nr:uncharacterized protein A4U43_C04F18580 [Asparagus officinalis]
MAGDSTPKANLNADHSESDDAQRKRAKPAITLRPTASFGAYYDFMRNLVMRMGPRHFAAYEDSVFRHCVQFGPPGVDLPTFEHILSQWDKKSKKFVFTDRNDGEEIACSFNLDRRRQGSWPKRPSSQEEEESRGPRDLLHKKKRRAEDDDIPIDADIDEDAEQPNKAVKQIEWPQQVIYWKSIAAMNQALRRKNENKFKGMIAADRVKISALSVKVAKLSAQNRRLREELSEARSGTLSVYKDKSTTGLTLQAPWVALMEGLSTTIFSDIHKESEDAPPGELPPPEAYRIDKVLEAEINEGEKVSLPAKELLTCTETGTQREGTGREITPAVEVPSAGDGETQTCIDTLREDTGMEIKQSENAPPSAIETSTDDEDAPIVFSRALNKRKRGATGAREKVAAAAPPKRKICKRSVKPSKWVVTPYTEGKKKKEKDNIGNKAIIEVVGEEEAQVQEKVAELAPARLQSDAHSI